MLEISCRGLLFDLDGVLVDSTPAVARVWTKWAIAHGFDPDETVRLAHGRPSIATIRDLLPGANYEEENAVVLRGEIEDTDGVIALPGARELLNSLPPARWAVVTSCSRSLAEVRLKTAGLPYPQQVVTSEDVARGKPDAEPYQKGARLLGASPSDCVVFEDAPAGIQAGKAAGCTVIALRTTVCDRELEQAGADWILPGYDSLVALTSNHADDAIRLQLRD
ncbi:MAG: HAD family hydrolase [Acidobacteria bacterium]|nr:HAD family hydrolase [Acidobacteriota bacterium]